MKTNEKPMILRGFIEGTVFWTFLVALAWFIYPLGAEGWEAAGFFLMILGFPSTYLSQFIASKSTVFWQVTWFSILGYLQWPLLGIILRALKERKNNS
jgi:hypothetical protein